MTLAGIVNKRESQNLGTLDFPEISYRKATVARTFGNGAYRQRESLFGAPRGNAVMKAKRVTGDSARTILLRSIALERCGKCKQTGKVLYTHNPNGTTKKRVCSDCLGTMPKQEKGCDVVALLSMPTRNGG